MLGFFLLQVIFSVALVVNRAYKRVQQTAANNTLRIRKCPRPS